MAAQCFLFCTLAFPRDIKIPKDTTTGMTVKITPARQVTGNNAMLYSRKLRKITLDKDQILEATTINLNL